MIITRRSSRLARLAAAGTLAVLLLTGCTETSSDPGLLSDPTLTASGEGSEPQTFGFDTQPGKTFILDVTCEKATRLEVTLREAGTEETTLGFKCGQPTQVTHDRASTAAGPLQVKILPLGTAKPKDATPDAVYGWDDPPPPDSTFRVRITPDNTEATR